MNDVVVVGGGVAGLVCALEAHRQGLSVLVLEAGDAPGGRIRSDQVDGFTLDRGFQVLLTAYPEPQRYLDLDALQLRRFQPGAMVWHDGGFHHVADPRRMVSAAWESLWAPIGTAGDKFRVMRLAAQLERKSLEEIAVALETTTLRYLQDQGFSDKIIERFFRPFFGGIFLERQLSTSSRKFEFVFKMFTEGFAAVPARGMRAIPEQLAAKLPPDILRLRTRVVALTRDRVTVEGGEEIHARAVVLATDPAATRKMWDEPSPPMCSTLCMYFSADESPVDAPVLMLNGEGLGPVNHAVVMSDVAREYAPEGKSLISVSVVGVPEMESRELEERVRRQLTTWFGRKVSRWKLVKTYPVWQALPLQSPELGGVRSGVAERESVILAGDYLENGSTNGAMKSGRAAAEAVCARLQVAAVS